MNPHSYRLKGRDFVHQGKIEIDVNERAVFIRLKAAFSFTPTPIVSLTVCRIQKFNMKCEIERMEIIYTFYFFAFFEKVIKKLLTFCYW